MKKTLLTALAAVMLVVSAQGVILARAQEAVPAQNAQTQAMQTEEGSLPGEVPAQSSAVDSMTPALHAVVLAMLNHEQAVFDSGDPVLGWEALYNMLSLYGQLDERSDYVGEDLVLPVETVMDFSAALVPSFSQLGGLPEDLSDRLAYDEEIDSYLVACGSDSLAQIQVTQLENQNGTLNVTGALVYLVDGSDLAQFRAVLAPRDNMFGYTIAEMELL